MPLPGLSFAPKSVFSNAICFRVAPFDRRGARGQSLAMRTVVVLGACGLFLCGSALAAGEDKLAKGRAALATGDLATARDVATRAGVEGKVLLAEIDRTTGNYAEARALLEGVVKKNKRNLRARMVLGVVYEETGEKKLADAVWNAFFDDSDAGRIEDKAEPLTYLAVAARYLE